MTPLPRRSRATLAPILPLPFCVPSSRYGRRDSLQVVGTPHSFAILVSSWASSVCVVLCVSVECVDLMSNASPQLSHWVHAVCGVEIDSILLSEDCMRMWYAEQETSAIYEGLIAELVEAYE